jgi:hypothetical protein
MAHTYKAILKGDRVEWIGKAPDTNGGVAVEITVVGEPAHAEDDAARSKRLRQLLDELAARNPFAEIDDPVAWQRGIRKDRPLPGRDD